MLQNRVVLITGSSSGIGEATARLAKSYGAEVIVHDKAPSQALEDLAKKLGARVITCDIADEAAARSAVRGIDKIDVLVNCAGINSANSLEETSDEEWLEAYRMNVLGTVHMCKQVIPLMQKNRYGRIVNIASIRGYGITSGRTAYSASKAAIINLTASLAKEFSPIAVNAVSPGFTNTAMAKTWSEAVRAQTMQSLLRRIAEPAEIAEAICFLSSDKASFITGQTLLVDGGYSIAGK